MAAMKLLTVVLIMVLLLHPKTPESHWIAHRPLCSSQFALVNRACSLLPYTPIAPPAPPAPDNGPAQGGHGHRHGHGHGHRHRRHAHRETAAEEECCRWMKEVDNECVCDVLAHLPGFLTRPVHNYTVVVDETCQITFRCSSRLVI